MMAYHNSKIPKWMSRENFDKTIKAFSTKMVNGPQTSIVQANGVDVLVSSPEQYNYIDLYYIMEQLTSLRADVVQTLLEHIKISITVR